MRGRNAKTSSDGSRKMLHALWDSDDQREITVVILRRYKVVKICELHLHSMEGHGILAKMMNKDVS